MDRETASENINSSLEKYYKTGIKPIDLNMIIQELLPLYGKILEIYRNNPRGFSDLMDIIQHHAISKSRLSFEELPQKEIFDLFYKYYSTSLELYINGYNQELVPYRSLMISQYLGMKSVENIIKKYDDITTPIIKLPDKRKSYMGLALCHTKQQMAIEKRFDQLKDLDIKWNYVDLTAIPDDNQIKGSIYDGDTFKKCKDMEPEGYDFVAMSFCTPYTGDLFLYSCITPIIGGSSLLKNTGKLLSNNFVITVIQYLDPQLRDSRKAFFEKRSEFEELATTLIEQENIDKTQRAIHRPFTSLWQKAANIRLHRLYNDRHFMETQFNKFCEGICIVAGFTSFQIIERAEMKHTIIFNKN